MTKIIKNKLVRDLVPDYIEKKGQTPEVIILDDEKFIKELSKKLIEEAEEVVGAIDESQERLIEEISDLYEVIESLAKVNNITKEQIVEIQSKKNNSNGKFDKKFYLISVEDNN